jgi:hypothetical protein
VRESSWGLRRPKRGGFVSLAFPRSSVTTEVTLEPRSGMLDSTNTCGRARMICALERRERAAHRGDTDIVFSYLYRSDRPCMSLYDLYYVVTADGEGWRKRTFGVNP